MAASNEINYNTKMKINVTANPLTQPSLAANAKPSTTLLSTNTHFSQNHLFPPHLSTDPNITTKTTLPNVNPHKWSCIQCTFLNDFYYSHCSICGASKSTDTSPLHVIQESDDEKQSSTSHTEWQCTVCTLINHQHTLHCSVCNNPKPLTKTLPSREASVSSDSHPKTSTNNSTTPSLNEHSNAKWRCVHCNDTNDYDSTLCMEFGEDGHMKSDWCCDACNYTNDWNITRVHDIACCLQCGAPNLSINSTMAPLERVDHDVASLPPLEDWQCDRCTMVNPYHSDRCCRCDEVNDSGRNDILDYDDNGWSSNGIEFRSNDNDNELKYKYNELELSEQEQQWLVSGYCRRYCNGRYCDAMFEQTVLWCFGCYLATDYLTIDTDMIAHTFYGKMWTKEEYIYSWKVRIATGIKGLLCVRMSVLIGLCNVNTKNIDYAIHSSGSRGGTDDTYCKTLESGDIVSIKYDKRRGVLEYGIADKWYGIAYDSVKDEQYQLVVSITGVRRIPNVQLLQHHWTSQL